MKLTQKACAALTLDEGETDRFTWCETLPGFGYRLRRGAGGKKVNASWVCQYRFNRASRRMLLGSAAVLKCDQARKLAQQALGKVANGVDPQAAKDASTDQHSFKTAVGDYLAAKKHEVRPATMREVSRYLTDKRYFGPLHNKPLDQIKRSDIAKCLSPLTSWKPITAARARAVLSTFFSWALAEGLLGDGDNPVVGTKTSKPAPADDRVLSDSELVCIWNACDGANDYDRIVKLAILTGMRRQEIGGLSWSEIDLDKGSITIPAARSKNRRAHTLPLLPEIRRVIEEIPVQASRDWLFGQRAQGFNAWAEGKRLLDARVKKDIQQPWVLHSIRKSVATGMAELGVLPHIIEQILNHVSGHKGGVAGIYNKATYEPLVKSALTLWHEHLRTLIDSKERKEAA